MTTLTGIGMDVLLGVSIPLLIADITLTRRWAKRQAKKFQALFTGQQVLLRQKIHETHVATTARGSITIDELTEIEVVYTTYKDLGGNGRGDLMMEDIRALPRMTRSNNDS